MDTKRDAAVLLARIDDAVRIAENGQPHFLGFLDERRAAMAAAHLRAQGFVNYLLWGGHAEAERVLLGAFPPYREPAAEAFPLVGVTVTYRAADNLTHRDFLGALLSKGVVRETLGDILVEEGRCVLFAREEVAPFLLQQTDKIGRVGVRLSPGFCVPLPIAHSYEDFSGVVASARLDCIVAEVLGKSRSAAAELITAGLVTLNHVEAASLSAEVAEGATLSVRGYGRFMIDRVGPLTKKGRLGLAGRRLI